MKTYKLLAVISTVLFFAAVLGIAYYSSQPPANNSQQQAAAEQKDRNQYQNQNVEPTIWQFMFPDSISVFTFWLVVATVGLCIVSIIQISALNRQERISAAAAQAAQTSANVAKDTLIASRRPWIMVDVDIEGGEFANDGLHLTLKFTLQNKGNDPALYVFPDFEILSSVDRGPGYVRKELQRFCGDFKERQSRGGPNSGGFTVFPGQPRVISITPSMSQEEIDRDIASGPLTAKESKERGLPILIRPLVLGCVDYQFSLSQKDHQTWFAYDVWDKGIGTYGGSLVLVAPGVIEKGRLYLSPRLIDRDAFYAD